MESASIKIIDKSEVEQFPCKGLKLVTCFVVKNSTANGKPSVIMRFTDGENFYEYETTGNLFEAMASAVPQIHPGGAW